MKTASKTSKILSDEHKNILKVIESHGVPVTYIYGSYDVYKDGKLLCE